MTINLPQDKTGYTIMFGPDKCSPNGKVHLIFRYRNPKNGTISVSCGSTSYFFYLLLDGTSVFHHFCELISLGSLG